MDALASVMSFEGYTVSEKLGIYNASMLSLEHINNSASEDILSDFTQQEVPFFIIRPVLKLPHTIFQSLFPLMVFCKNRKNHCRSRRDKNWFGKIRVSG